MSEENRIQATFQNKTIFITGGSGFLGRVLIEKLLRCSNPKKIYLLLRTKKGKGPRERLNELFDNVLFSKLKSLKPDALKCCSVIAGDVGEVDLGISQDNRKILQDEIEFIFNSAASTRFDDSVRTAVKINTRGTKYVLDLALKCPKLKSFIHVSTAFAFPRETILYEKAYKPPADPHKIISEIDFERDEDEETRKRILQDYPNTYIYSKALAEGLVSEYMDILPITVLRPSVVCPVLKDPLPGWCNNLQGPMGLFVGAGKGVIRSVYINKDAIADFIPADYVINGMIIAAWLTAEKKQRCKFVNAVSSNDMPMSWEDLIECGKSVVYNDVPFNTIAWYPGGSLEGNKTIHLINVFLFQFIPAIFIDLLLLIMGYKPILLKSQKRIQTGLEMFEYFAIKNWAFAATVAQEIRVLLNDKEKETYKIDPNGIDIYQYLRECILFSRRHILKETDDMLPRARLVMKIMYWVDKLCKTLFILFAIKFAYKHVLQPILLRH